MRCLTLANELRASGAATVFVCRGQPGDFCDFIEHQGHRVSRISPPEHQRAVDSRDPKEEVLRTDWEQDAKKTRESLLNDGVFDWLVVDHYSIDKKWESAMRTTARNIFVIDDLADREHDCDLILDQNFYLNSGDRYAGLVPGHCRRLLGPSYALLRREFYDARRRAVVRGSGAHRLLISFGSSDPSNETSKAIEAIKHANCQDPAADVVIGGTNPHRDEIVRACSGNSGLRLHVQASNMAELCLSADIGLGAGGSALWERCLLGLPSLVVITAANQAHVVHDVSATNAIINCGWNYEVTSESLAASLSALQSDRQRIAQMSKACFDLMGERGPISPVVDAMLAYPNRLSTRAGSPRSSSR